MRGLVLVVDALLPARLPTVIPCPSGARTADDTSPSALGLPWNAQGCHSANGLLPSIIYVTNLKSVSSMKLRRDLRLTQKTSWFLLHRLREAWGGLEKMDGPVEVDETYFGGKRKNMPASKRKTLTGRGAVDKTAVVGMKDRKTNKVKATVVSSTTQASTAGLYPTKALNPDQRFTLTTIEATLDFTAITDTAPSSTRSSSLWMDKPTPTASSHSGLC